ncbi:Thioester reductase domain-containing protein [Pseudomonas flavescens]|uniref:Thioester reductase domain-containing protein n=1 Tax=Phytopseudomonas flavescens TaxID=29435 RepID=A0A1G8FDT6_9GAMM|nr:SDR family oxidoreductase [Pseudomonas flavescens]SDH80344.1 Thioester reductase domain-containing protein [Pseudomonas flavescens]
MNTSCLVTGGSGFIGQHLLSTLTAHDHAVTVLMRRPADFPRLAERVAALGGKPRRLTVIHGDLALPGLGLDAAALRQVAGCACFFHLGAQFAWGLSMAQARQVNVEGARQVARLAVHSGARLLMVGGYMLCNAAQLARVGVDGRYPEHTDWPAVYRRVGGYEGSKLEAHYRVLDDMQRLGGELTLVHPATLCGHSQSGHILPGQPLAELVRQLLAGRLSALPGSPMHWLPLISVDFLVELIRLAAFDPLMAGRSLLALDERTPSLHGLVQLLGRTLRVAAPQHHVPMGLLKALLRVPGMPRLLRIAPESLDFIQVERFDMTQTGVFLSRHQRHWPAIEQAIAASARFVAAGR